jgi:hypothetical protein
MATTLHGKGASFLFEVEMSKPRAMKPITWPEMQAILSQLGYEFLSHDHTEGCARFALRQGALTENMKNPITIDHPDFVATDDSTAAYERDYVVDLLNHLFGGNGGKAIAVILANR